MFIKGEGRYWDNLSQGDRPQYTHDTEYCYFLKKALLCVYTNQITVGIRIYSVGDIGQYIPNYARQCNNCKHYQGTHGVAAVELGDMMEGR